MRTQAPCSAAQAVCVGRARLGRVVDWDTPERRSQRALSFIAHRAAYYGREGVTTCGVCGAPEPPPSPRFLDCLKPMQCGHDWSALVWRRNPPPGERARAAGST